MNFSNVKAIAIPEGDVTQISVGGSVIWQKVTGVLQMLNPYGVPPSNKFINRLNGGETAPSETGGVWRHSEYIAVEADTEYLFGMAVYATASTAGLAWYDSTQTFISGINATAIENANGVITSPAEAAYLRISWRIDEGYNTDWEHQVWLCKNGVCDHWTPWLGEHVPSEYQLLLYIQSSGTQYLNTGIAINYATQKIEQRAIVQYTTSTNNRELMGANGYGFWGKSASDKLEAPLGSIVTVTESALDKNTISLTTNPQNNNVLFIVNDSQYSITATSFSNNNYACYVFAIGGRSGAAASFFCKAKVYEYEILLNDEIVSHLVPVKRLVDGVIGMWDSVGFQFLTNAGSGTFVPGYKT